MYKRIMVPVDLEHLDALDRGLAVAADLAGLYECPVCYVGVTTETPSPVARTPAEFTKKLDAFARRQGELHDIRAEARAYASHDPATDLDEHLRQAIEEMDADLVVVASHVPSFTDFLQHAHGTRLAGHAPVSVFIVR